MHGKSVRVRLTKEQLLKLYDEWESEIASLKAEVEKLNGDIKTLNHLLANAQKVANEETAALTASEQRVKVLEGLSYGTPAERFEQAIREFGIESACEWFGYDKDHEFTKDTKKTLDERLAALSDTERGT